MPSGWESKIIFRVTDCCAAIGSWFAPLAHFCKDSLIDVCNADNNVVILRKFLKTSCPTVSQATRLLLSLHEQLDLLIAVGVIDDVHKKALESLKRLCGPEHQHTLQCKTIISFAKHERGGTSGNKEAKTLL